MSTKRIDTRHYSDRREYLKLAVTKRRQTLKVRAVKIMGGMCMLCGYKNHPGVFDFHHVDASTKLFGVSSGGFSRSWTSIYSEIQKCVLVCANCHREIELGLHDKATIEKIHEDFWDVMNTSLAPGTGLEPAT